MPTPALAQCVVQFIKTILCQNAILRSTFKTFLNSQILLANGAIAALGAEIIALDIINAFVQLEIQTVATIKNKIQSDLNVVFGPMSGYATCPAITQLLQRAENAMPTIPGIPAGGSVTKFLAGLQNLINEYNRRQYVRNTISDYVIQLQAFVNQAQTILDNIDSVCSNS
jgi:hypothetical protein